MILTCPSCATSYFTPDDAIPSGGRKVRCQSCSHVWHATNDEPLELTADSAPVAAENKSFEDAPPVAPETPAPELPKAFRARAEQQRRMRRAATHGVVWAGLASMFVGLLAAGWLFRVEVVDMYPRAARAYAKVGLEVNPTGLDFEAVNGAVVPNQPGMVMVSGAVRNIRDREIVSPPVRVSLRDARGAEVGHVVVRMEGAPVLPGGVKGFAGLVPDPGAHGVDIKVDFVSAEAVALAAQAEAQARSSAPARARPLPTADDHGMRPAIIEEAPRPHTAPVDAAPVQPPIDSHGPEAVSASHG